MPKREVRGYAAAAIDAGGTSQVEPEPSRAPSTSGRRSPPSRRVIVAALSVAAFVLAGAGPPEKESSRPSATEVASLMVDLLVLRPLGAAATALGFGFFLAAGPLSAPSGQLGDAWDFLVMSPYQYTFGRKLGELEDL